MKRFALLVLCAIVAPALAGPRVDAPAGRIEGKDTGAVEAFLGVPYAAAPVGALRWRAPAPAPRWTKVRQASAIGADCVQDSKNNPLPAGYTNQQSEDCLFLNIWRPEGTPAARLPVMVWIHGGAFIMGSGSMPDYDGAALAARGAIVVTLNYRLGRFGTFVHPELFKEQAGQPIANYGMMDQIAALKWVRDNIAAFGGDAANVTIFGESAGASSVNFLMTSPAVKGLFAKAISESGGRNDVLDSVEAAAAKCSAWATTKRATTLAQLRALSADTILDAPVTVPARPVIDGKLVVARTDVAFRTGLAAKVPYLVGSNDFEESLLRWFPGGGEAMVRQFGDKAPALLAAYAASGDTRERQVGRLWGENAMTEPARWRAKQQAAHGAPVYLYRFAYLPEALRDTTPGAGHADEIPFVFDNGPPRPGYQWTAADHATARLVGDYWLAFARTGNPNHPGAPDWPAFTPGADRLQLINGQGTTTVSDFARARLDLVEAAAGSADAR